MTTLRGWMAACAGLLLGACATSEPAKKPAAVEAAPDWVASGSGPSEHGGAEVIAGVGYAEPKIKNVSMRRSTADMRARAAAATELDALVSLISKRLTPPDAAPAPSRESLDPSEEIRAASQSMLDGFKVVAHHVAADGGEFALGILPHDVWLKSMLPVLEKHRPEMGRRAAAEYPAVWKEWAASRRSPRNGNRP